MRRDRLAKDVLNQVTAAQPPSPCPKTLGGHANKELDVSRKCHLHFVEEKDEMPLRSSQNGREGEGTPPAIKCSFHHSISYNRKLLKTIT